VFYKMAFLNKSLLCNKSMCCSLFFLLATNSQKDILQIQSDKIMCFLKFSIARIRKIARFLYMVQVGGQNYRRMFLNKSPFIFSFEPNLVKYSCGSLPIWLQQKIDEKKHRCADCCSLLR